MKKVFWAVAAMAMLATACTKDDAVSGGNESLVSFTINSPELQTRVTDGKGESITHLQYAFYSDGVFLDQISKVGDDAIEFTGSTTIPVYLVEGRTYQAIFWADNEDAPYNVDFTYANRKMTISSTAWTANSDIYDAFYKYQDNIDPADKTHTITLTRPFAQINVATGDTENAKNAGVEVVSTEMVAYQAYTTLDLVGGTVSDKAEFTYEFAATPKDPKAVELNGKTYDMLAMNYVLVNGRELMQKVTLKASENTDGTSPITREYTTVPVQRNYRTYIVGNLLTTSNDFEIETKPGFDGEEGKVDGINYTEVKTAADLIEAINSGYYDEIILTGDIDLSALSTRAATTTVLTISEGSSLTLDLNGYNIVGVDTTEKNYGLIQNNGTLVLKNSSATISSIKTSATVNSGWNRYSAVISNNPGATLTVGANILIEHLGGTDMAYGIDQLTNGGIGDVNGTIDGATIKSAYRAVRQFLNSDSKENNLTIKAGSVIEGANKGIFFHDPSKKANNGKLVVEDGATVNSAYLFVTEGSTEWPVEVSIAATAIAADQLTAKNVPAGYGVVNYNGYYIVVSGAVSTIEELQAALNSEESVTINFLTDIAGEAWLAQKDDVNVTINGNGKKYDGEIKIHGNSGYRSGITTIKNINFETQNASVNFVYAVDFGSAKRYSNNINVENCTFTAVAGSAAEKTSVGVQVNATKNLVVKGCTATNMHSLLQAQSCDSSIVVDGAAVSGGKNGVSFGNTAYPTLKNSNITAAEYGVRADGNASRGNLVVENTTITANQGIVVRKVTSDGYAVNLGEGVEINTGELYDVVFTTGSDDVAYVAPTAKYTYSSVNDFVVFPYTIYVTNSDELKAALQAGGEYTLANNIALNEPIQISGKEFTLKGNGYKIGQSSTYPVEETATTALIHPINCTATIENVVFDGLKGDGPIRTVDTKLTIKNVTVQNCERTVTGSTAQGLFRLHGESYVESCTFKNNICPMGVSINWDGNNDLPQAVTNCVFENNKCHATAVLYYVKGSECKVIGNKFIGNTVTVTGGSNAATVYMGFTENNVIKNNLFKNNTVNVGTSKRVAGGVMIGYAATITGNAFIGNTVNGENAKANDVCASVYYTSIDLSGNYWGGGAPVENDDYYVEYKGENDVIVNDYLTSYSE